MANLIPPMLVEIQLETAKIKQGLTDINSNLSNFGKTVEQQSGFLEKFKATAVGVFGGNLITQGMMGIQQAFKASIVDAQNYERALAKAGAIIESTGNVAGVSVGHFKSMAGSLEALTSIDENLILQSMNVMATFTQVRNVVGKGNDVFDQATKAALDLSTVMEGDLQGATLQLGKALNDPIKGVGALSRVGVTFTTDQKAMIKSLVESSDVLGAQKIILGEVNREFGGAGKAVGDTFAGGVSRAKDKVTDFTRDLIINLQPILLNIGKTIGDLINKYIKPFVDLLIKNKEAIVVFGVVVGVAIIALYAYRAAVIVVKAAQEAWAVKQALLKGVQLASIASTNGMAASMLVLNTVMKQNVIGIVITAIGLLAAGFVVVWNHSESFRKVMIAVGKAGLMAIGFILDQVGGLATGILKVVTGPMRLLLKGLELLGVKGAGTALKEINGSIDSVGKFFDDAAKKVKSYSGALDALANKKIKLPSFGGAATPDTSGGGDAPTVGMTPAQIKAKEAADKKAAAALQKHADLLAKYSEQVQGIYDDMNTAIADGQDKANAALAKRDEAIASAQINYLEKVASLKEQFNERMIAADDAYLEATAAAHERNAELLANIEKDYADKIKSIDTDLADKQAEIIANASEAETAIKEKYAEKDLDLKAKANEKIQSLTDAYHEKIADLNAASVEKLASIEAKYQEKRADLEASAKEKLVDLETKYHDKVASLNEASANKGIELEKAYILKVGDLRKTASDKALNLVKDAAQKQADIVRQSVDRLKSSFASGVGTVSLADAFAPSGGGTDKLLSDLRTKLQSAKDLQANAAALAGMGYSQAFIEEVVKNGPEAGNAIAVALKAASPAATAELQSLYSEINTLSAHGLDELASNMNSGANLATDELRNAYAQVSVDLHTALSELNVTLTSDLGVLATAHKEAMDALSLDLGASLIKTNADYEMSIAAVNATLVKGLADAKAAYDASNAETAKALIKDLADAKAVLDKNLAETKAALTKDLLDSQVELDKAIAANTKKMNDSLAEAQKAHDKAIAAATVVRDEALASAVITLQKALDAADVALTKAQEKANKDLAKAMIDAEKVLTDALIAAQKSYDASLDAIEKATIAKIEALKIKLAEVAALLAAIGEKNASLTALANAPIAPVKPIVENPPIGGPSGNLGKGGDQGKKGTTVTVNAPITNNNTTTPSDMGETIVQIVKFGLVVT